MPDSFISEGVITSLFIQKDRHAIEVAGHNSVNITKSEKPQSAEKCLTFRMFIGSINIDKLEDMVTMFEFDN